MTIGPGGFPNGPPVERPRSSTAIACKLRAPFDDADYFLVNKTTNEVLPFVGYPIQPACKIYNDVFLKVALMGPIDVIDPITKKAMFTKPSGKEPFHVPEGYGVIIREHRPLKPGERRTIYEEEFGLNEFFLPNDLTVECINDFDNPDCDNTNIIVAHSATPAEYYWVVYYDSDDGCYGKRWPKARTHFGRKLKDWKRQTGRCLDFIDYSIVVGVEDDFQSSDFARFATISEFISDGRLVHNECETPYEDDE